MLNLPVRSSLLTGLLILTAAHGAALADILVSEDSEWRYLKGFGEASSPDPAAWRYAGFPDASWSVGRGPFYYEDASGYTGNTMLSDMNGGYTCVFLRGTFQLVNPAAIRELTLTLQSDDGCVVWLNGNRVRQVNMADGEPSFDWTSLPAAGEPNVDTVVITDPGTLLRTGTNVLAIQAFNAALSGSSDFLIAAALTGDVDLVAPELVEVVPAASATVRTLTGIEVFFSENVTGVEAGDLLINGSPATNLAVYSPRNYAFQFPEPPPGGVTVAWAASAGITDLAVPPNAFAGGSWNYMVDPTLPPEDVIISEFLADNENGIRDNFGVRSDWIELLNRGDSPANLEGWFLTDDLQDLTKWRLPAVTLGANSYLIVWASGEDQANPFASLHTSFRLAPSDETVALVNPQTNVVSAFSPVYPPQQADVSYGRDRANPSAVGYYLTPTPGAANSTSGPGFAPGILCSLPGGVYTNSSLSVTLSSPSGTVRYTTDGTVPTTTSTIYTGPIAVLQSTVIQARVFETGLLPGPILVQIYNLVGTGLGTYSSNLPILIVNTLGQWIGAETRIPAFVTAIEPFRGRASVVTPPQFLGNAQIEVRGQTSAGFPKLPYNLELNDPQGNDLEVPLLGLPAESDWVLYNPYSDKPFLQNFLAFELHEKMGHYAPRRRFVEVFVDTSGGKLDYPGDYVGIYILLEKIKVDGNRVDLARLTPQQNAEPEISGGYMIKKDKDSPGDLGFGTQGGSGFSGQYLKIHEPKPREITPTQLAWIRNYLNQMERCLYAVNWLTATGTNHYSHYLDVDSFVDQHWIVEFSKQIDGYRLSNYMNKDRGGKLRMDPVWDWNLSFGNADYLDGAITSGWYYSLIGDSEHIWLRRLITGTTSPSTTLGDPDFNQKIADRWSVLRTNIMSSTNVVARIDELAAYLNEAQARDFAKWPRLGTYVWPNPPIYSTPTTYAGIIANMKNWVRSRYNWIDTQFVKAPEFSRGDSGVSPGFPLTLSAPAGTIYYTTDGTDPRTPHGGGAPLARPYTGAIIIQTNTRVVARVLDGTRWSGPSAATFTVDVPPLVLAELMYSPAPTPGATTNDAARFEYLELLNTGTQTLDLRGFRFTGGIQFEFAAGGVTSLGPGERVVVARDPAALVSRHGVVANLAGPYGGSLANEGERLTLVGPMQEAVFDLSWDPDWYPATDGLGFALAAAAEGQPDVNAPGAGNWRVGAPGGTPGRAEPPATSIPPILVNEVLSHTDPPLTGSIELYNPTATEVDLGGWFLSDDQLTPKYRIPAETRLAAGTCRVFTEADFNPTPGVPPSFTLRASGDEAFLYSADAQGHLTGYVQGHRFGAALNGVSFGRYVTSTGEANFVAQAARSLGETNGPPQVGPVVISEIMYRPPDVLTNNAYWDNTEDEFIELCNVSGSTVNLFDAAAPTNAWRLRDAVDYTFPTNLTMNPGTRLLVVSFDPVADPARATAFRSRYGLNASVPLYGPYQGKLANDRDAVELIQPDTVRFYVTNLVVTSVLVDKVAYRDDSPWPAGADGLGFSLQRQVESAYGNDPTNWIAAAPTPDVPLAPAETPAIRQDPASQTATPGSNVALTVEATGPDPLSYQWRFEGANLPGAQGATLILTNVQPSQSGRYEVVVSTPSRSIGSAPAELRVARPPILLGQPVSQATPPGEDINFSVVAAGDSPLRYQWRRNGSPVPGGTRSVLTLTDVTEVQSGTYDVVVSDGILAVTSDAATLTVQEVDTDGDGMPDAFETANGLDPRNPADAQLDADLDGASNLDEYRAGTDPQDPASVFRVEEVRVASTVLIRFWGLTDRSYTVLCRDAVHAGPWRPVASVPETGGPGGELRLIEVVDPEILTEQRYYRLVTPAQNP
jgi:hypothetical protein